MSAKAVHDRRGRAAANHACRQPYRTKAPKRFGIALMPRSEELAGGKLRIVEVASLTAQIPVALVRRKGGVRSKSEIALADHLCERIPGMLDS